MHRCVCNGERPCRPRRRPERRSKIPKDSLPPAAVHSSSATASNLPDHADAPGDRHRVYAAGPGHGPGACLRRRRRRAARRPVPGAWLHAAARAAVLRTRVPPPPRCRGGGPAPVAPLRRGAAAQPPDHGEALLELTDRAEGRLRSLCLLGCPRVSDAGLLRVVERNPFITELFVPRCTGLTADGLVKVLHFLHEHKGNLSRLRLHGICKMTKHHLDTFNTIMCPSSRQKDAQELYYNHRVHEVLNTDDERPIDVDFCPMCRNVRLVFDCTRDECRKDSWPHCRGCFFCVARCETCGGCIDLEELGETGLACSDFLCMDCWLKLPKCCTCNRPYCERHSELKENLSPSGQFTCQECMAFATSHGGLEEGY